MALPPVPIDATFFPVKSYAWFHAEEWKISPLNFSIPLIFGICATCKGPEAKIKNWAWIVEPSLVSTCHWHKFSS